MADYNFSIGLNVSEVVKGFNDVDDGAEGMQKAVDESTKSMQTSFNAVSASSDKMGDTMTKNMEKVTTSATEAAAAGKSISESLSGKGVGDDLGKKVDALGDKLSRFRAAAKDKVKFDADVAKLEKIIPILDAGKAGFKELKDTVEGLESVMQQFDPGSQEFTELGEKVNAAKAFLAEFGDQSEKTEKKTLSLKAQLRAMQAELVRMSIAGEQDTQAFRDMEVAAGQLKDEIGDVGDRVKALSSDTKYLDATLEAIQGLTGAFAAGQAAVSLFGGENEDLQKVMTTTMQVMQLLQGVQLVMNAINKNSTLSTILFAKAQQATIPAIGAETVALEAEAVAATEAAAATKGFTATLLANPLTAIAVAVAAVIAALVAFTSSSKDAEEQTEALNLALEHQNTLFDLDKATIDRRAQLTAASIKSAGALAEAGAKTELQRAKISADTNEKLYQNEKESSEQRLALIKANQKKLAEIYDKSDDAKQKEEANAKWIALDQERLNEENKIKIAEFEVISDRSKNQIQQNKIREQDQKEAADKLKKAAEDEQKALEQRVKFAKALRDTETAQISDAYEKQRQIVINATTDKIEALNAEKSLSEEAAKLRNQIIIGLQQEQSQKLIEINQKEVADWATLQLSANKIIEELNADSTQVQLDALKRQYDQKRAEILSQYANEASLRDKLIKAINDKETAEHDKILNDKKVNDIDAEEERQVLLVETAARFVGKGAEIEEAKQKAILEVQIKYAKQKLQQLKDNGELENSTQVLQAKKAVQDLEAQADALAQKHPKGIFDLQSIIFGDQGEEGNKAISDALQKSYQSIQQITDAIVSQYQRQIDAKQKVIDQYNSDIDTLEQQLDKEKQLQEEGYANNVDMLQAEIDQKKKLRDDEIKQQQELQEKQKAVAKAQFALDTAVQASNLITAATQIFKSFAAIPFGLGIPLAIATVALMTGAFVAARVKTYQAIQDGQNSQSFGEGGWIDGDSHAAGGVKYYSADGKAVRELEGGEHVTNKIAARKHAALLDAINGDNLSGMSEEALRHMLEPLGIHLSNDDQKKSIQLHKENEALKVTVKSNDVDNKALKSMQNDLNFLAQNKREEVIQYEDQDFFYTVKGNKTTKRRKK